MSHRPRLAATLRTTLARLPRPRPETVRWGLLAVNVQALFLVAHAAVLDRSLLTPFPWYPVVWITVGLWALVRVDPPAASRRARAVAGAAAAAYVLLLALTSNTVWLGGAFTGTPATGLEVRAFVPPPGWAPTVLYNGELLHLSLKPPFAVGFLALGYLLYATVLEARAVASLGLLAVFSCLSCTLPVVLAAVAVVTGASAGPLLAGSSSLLLPGGTLLYVVSVALLYWRPGVEGTAGGSGAG